MMSVAVITRLDRMARWEPGARERLQQAALELFADPRLRADDRAEIAQSVGLTERTFFRHFTDKREVLFDGQDLLQQAFLDGVRAAPRPRRRSRWSPQPCGLGGVLHRRTPALVTSAPRGHHGRTPAYWNASC